MVAFNFLRSLLKICLFQFITTYLFLVCESVFEHWFYQTEVLAALSCLTLCDPMDYSPPGSSVHGILRARILEWVAISFSRGSSRHRDQTWVFHIAGRFFYLLSHQGSPSTSQFIKVVCVCVGQTLKSCHLRKG